MKGVIFNVVEEVVTELWSADMWDDVLEAADLLGAYTALGNYPDEELLALVGAASELSGLADDELLTAIGRRGLQRLVDRMPGATAGAEDAETFLRRVNDIIHPEVLKLYPAAVPPVFEFASTADGLEVTYRSARRLDQLAAGLIEGCGDLFGQTTRLVRTGGEPNDEEVVWLVDFGPVGGMT